MGFGSRREDTVVGLGFGRGSEVVLCETGSVVQVTKQK